MEIDGEGQTKRRAAASSEVEETTDDEYLHFFEHFTVQPMFWGVFLKVERMGLVYLHRGTNKPLMIVRRLAPENGEVTGYNVYFQCAEDKAQNKVVFIKLDLNQEGFIREDYQLALNFTLDQVAEQYIDEGVLADEHEAITYCDAFVKTMGLKMEQEVVVESLKRRKKHHTTVV